MGKERLMSSSLVRPTSGRWIGGVCAGLARRFGLSPNLVRLLFVLSCLLPGPQFIIYIILWILMPSER
jgi:phage shock protein PspC (stress-responsive transcriptional regulator)